MPRAGLLVSLSLGLASSPLILAGCFEAEGAGGETGDTAALVCAHDPPLTYDNFGRGYLRTHCAGCHSSGLPEGSREGAPLGIDLDTWEGALQWSERLAVVATGDSPSMPPAGGPTEDERARFAEWVDCELLPAAGVEP